MEGKNENTLIAKKDGLFTIEVTKGECVETKTILFKGLSFSENDKELKAPQIHNATYEWSFNGAIIDGATTHSLAVFSNGTYSVKIIFENESGRLNEIHELNYSHEVTDTTIVLENQKSLPDQNIKVYPIPFQNTVTLEFFEDFGKKISISVSNMNGKLLFQQDILVPNKGKIQLDIPDLKNGVYLLEALYSKGSYKIKIVK